MPNLQELIVAYTNWLEDLMDCLAQSTNQDKCKFFNTISNS